MKNQSNKRATYSLSFGTLLLCGTLSACSGSSGDKPATNNTSRPTNAQESYLANVDALFADATVKQYLATAQAGTGNGPLCQTQVDALQTAANKLAGTLSSNSDLEAGLTLLQQALQDLGTCLKGVKPDLPALPNFTVPDTGAATCNVVVVNKEVKQVGDCSKCNVTTNNGSTSVTCSGSVGGATGGTTGSNPGPVPGPTVPNAGSGTCQASLVNGQVTTTGDCGQCQINQDGGFVTVDCSGAIPGIPGGTTGGTTGAVGTCQASVVNGQVTTTGDCSKCDVQQNGGGVNVVCRP